MPAHPIDFEIQANVFSTPELSAIFDEKTRIGRWLQIEAALATVQGKLDIISQKIDFNIIIAPLRIVDRIFGIVPIVGGILQTILTVPVKIEGELKDPEITLLDPSVVGSELSNIVQDTFQNPIKLVYPGLK